MESVQYIGEHLLPGQIGHFAGIVSFVAALLSGSAYFMAASGKEASWLKIGRSAFITHIGALLTVIGTMFYLMVQQYYEYQYVWRMSPRNCRSSISSLRSGRARREVSCSGCSGTRCWESS